MARGERPARARAGPADDPDLLPPRPGPRPRPRPAADARRRHRPRRHPRRLRLRPPRRRSLGHPAPRRRRAARSRTCTPHDRGPQGTHHGAIIANGNLYCPATPAPLLATRPAAPRRHRRADRRARHQTAELARHKLGRITADDADGYHRVTCPAAAGKIRCPLRPGSMTLSRDRPEILTPPAAPARLLHPADHHRPPRSRQDRARNTTTPPPRTAAPTPAAPAPSAPSPPSRTPPPTTSPAAGAA